MANKKEAKNIKETTKKEENKKEKIKKEEEKSKEVAKKEKKTEKKEEKNKSVKNETKKSKKEEQVNKETNKKNRKDVKKDKEIEKEQKIKKETVTEVELEESTEIVKIEDIKKTIKEKKAVPKEEIKKINKKLFKNIIVAISIIIYFIFLNLGYMNIKNDIYVTDLQVFSICILLLAIILIEKAYKKDSGEIALYGVEMIVLSLTTLALIYVNLMISTKYTYIVTIISFVFAIYYLIKSIVIYSKRKKQYFVNDMKEIMNKDDEVE